MPQSVFSTVFVQAAGFTGGPVTLYTVPAGKRALVKTIAITWGDVSVSGLDAWVQAASLAKLYRRTILTGGSDPQSFGGSTVTFASWVLNAGDDLALQTVAGTCDFFISGYELQLP